MALGSLCVARNSGAVLALVAALVGCAADDDDDDSAEPATVPTQANAPPRAVLSTETTSPLRLAASTDAQAPPPRTAPQTRTLAGAPIARDEVGAPAPAAGGFQKSGIAAVGAGAPVVAVTVEIPSGWRTRGGLQWNEPEPCITSALRYEWQAASPDGMRAVELLPGFNWQVRGYAVQTNPCPVAAIGSAEGFLRALVAELYPRVTVTGYQDLTSTLTQPTATQPQQRLHAEAGRIEIAYPMRGVEMRETLATQVTFSEVASYGSRSVMGGVTYVLAARAPKASFDEALGSRVARSMVPNKPWFEQMTQHAMQLSNARSAAQRAEIARWHNSRMAEISAKGAADRTAIRSQTIRESGDPNFNPGAGGVEMQRVR